MSGWFCVLLFVSVVCAQRYVIPQSYNEAREQVRIAQANLCFPLQLMALVNETVAAMPGSSGSTAEFVARYFEQLKGVRSVCGGYGVVAHAMTQRALRTSADAASAEAFETYCRAYLGPAAAPSLLATIPLAHDDPLLRCVAVAKTVALMGAGFPLATGQRAL